MSCAPLAAISARVTGSANPCRSRNWNHGWQVASFQDFLDRVDLAALNKRTVESLIKAGAFDATGSPRKGLIAVFEQMLDAVVSRRRAEDMGQYSLFAATSLTASSRLPISVAEART